MKKKTKKGDIIKPQLKHVPVTIKDYVIGKDGKTYEVEKTVSVPKITQKINGDTSK